MADHARDGPVTPVPHRVGRLRFELDGADEAVLLRLRSEVVGGADSWIPAALDAAFSALDQPGRTLRVARLEVDLGVLPNSGLGRRQLTEALRGALAEHLRTVSQDAGAAPQSQSEHHTLAAAFRHFLASGRLPWWSPVESVAALELSLASLDVEAFRAVARSGAAILATLRGARRLVLQFSPQAAAQIAAALPAAKPADFQAATWPKPSDRQAVAALVARIRRVAAASPSGADKSAGPEIRDDGDEEQEAAARTAEAAPADDAEPPEDLFPADDLDIAVADAGLVLLHPYLPTLFEARGLVAAGSFQGEAEQLHALHLTAFLAAGESAREEPRMVMAKLLCGWPLDDPVPRDVGLDAADRAEAQELLQAVVGHWTALGQASPAALRETFLTRPGRLRARGSAWELEVERRGADVLLERLPWALTPLRLPWMAQPLHVVWS